MDFIIAFSKANFCTGSEEYFKETVKKKQAQRQSDRGKTWTCL